MKKLVILNNLPVEENSKNIKQVSISKSHLSKDIKLEPLRISKDSTVENKLIHKRKNTADLKLDISEYLDSAAGESLRVYIDGFELKQKERQEEDVKKINLTDISPSKSNDNSQSKYEKQYLFLKTEQSDISNNKSSEVLKSCELSNYSLVPTRPSVQSNLESVTPYEDVSLRSSTTSLDKIVRPPDIIDSIAMNPNFITDIDLSDRYESPSRSPGSESVIVSEDEPPIPLKIDKYFEHSPEFFGARLSDPNNSEIPSRRPTKRNSRLPKKPDSLTLQSNNNERSLKNDAERASSLPQSHVFTCQKFESPDAEENDKIEPYEIKGVSHNKENPDLKEPVNVEELHLENDTFCKDYVLRSGRKNSERALQIIQENSQILSRILTKQNNASLNNNNQTQEKMSVRESITDQNYKILTSPKVSETKSLTSPLLKESTSDSLIGCLKRVTKGIPADKNDILRIRPISIDDPFSLDSRNALAGNEEFSFRSMKTPSIESLGNKTDLYGWENKGFIAKCEYKNLSGRSNILNDEFKTKDSDVPIPRDLQLKDRRPISDEWSQYSYSSESKVSVTLPSSELKDTSTYDKRFTSDDYNYPLSSSTKYNDAMFLKTNEIICSKAIDQSPKIYENLVKTENSSYSDFSHRVTSSISFTCEPSIDDDSPIGAKSNSSDTLCQITSLDQISTPISPKIFPNRETPTQSRDSIDISDKAKIESDDTCSAITSLLETDTLSSLSYPRSPSTGSYHPFPTRPAMRLPKDLGVRLGMYPKESINSPQK